MLKRYIVLGLAFSFMSIGVSRCPFPFAVKSAHPHLSQAPAAVQPVAATAVNSTRL